MNQWLDNHKHLPFAAQHEALERMFTGYMGNAGQRDDVTVLGFSTKEFLC